MEIANVSHRTSLANEAAGTIPLSLHSGSYIAVEIGQWVRGGLYSPTNCREPLSHLRSAAKQMWPTPCVLRHSFLLGKRNKQRR